MDHLFKARFTPPHNTSGTNIPKSLMSKGNMQRMKNLRKTERKDSIIISYMRALYVSRENYTFSENKPSSLI